MPDMPIPFGDDVSGVSLISGETAVLKTDMLVGGTDVPEGMSLFAAARKAVVMNISDFAAKGVIPSAIVVALGLPKVLANEKSVTEIADGLDAGAREYGTYIIGGDTNETDDLIISLSLFGTTRNALMLRSGAKEGDIVAVTGLFGKPAAGLRLLAGGYKAATRIRDALVEAVFNPTARLAEGLALHGYNCVTASMDSSDGLAWSLHAIGQLSGVGFVIDTLPIAPEAENFAQANGLNAVDLAFYGGEEYELVLTVKPQKWEEAKAVVEAIQGCLIPIGRVTLADKQVVLELGDARRVLEAKGWEHFKRPF